MACATCASGVMGGRPPSQVIAKARVPIIKFEEVASGFNFDISFDIANGPVRSNPLHPQPLVRALTVLRGLGRWALNFSRTPRLRFCKCKAGMQASNALHGGLCAISFAIVYVAVFTSCCQTDHMK